MLDVAAHQCLSQSMARPLRVLIPDGWYHVFGRGWDRRAVFADDRDREHFLELLGDLHEIYRFRIHAYVLMDNHHHLLVQTPEANLSRGMQWFNTSYAAWFNARHQCVGTLWQGRYRAVVVQDGAWAYELSSYLHLNPLRVAGLGLDKRGRMLEGKGFRKPTAEQVTKRLARLRKYPWSSYRAYAGYTRAPRWLKTSELRRRAHADPQKRSLALRKDIKRRLTLGVEPAKLEQLRDIVAIGTGSFGRRIRSLVKDQESTFEHPRALRRRGTVGEVREAVEAVRGQSWDEFSCVRGDWGKPLFLWAVRKHCGLTLRETGDAAGRMSPRAVDIAISRWRKRVARDRVLRSKQEEIDMQLEDKEWIVEH
jgi:REP element-mobilizing transposase RayT